MSVSHLRELRTALERRGWRVIEKVRGEVDACGAGTWLVQRLGGGPIHQIDFAGFGPMGEDITLEESYACSLRGKPECGLYFRRIHRSRRLWEAELKAFVEALDE